MDERIFRESFQIGPESIDVMGHVNNREYLRWMERIAANHAASLGWTFQALKKHGSAWVTRQHWVEYLRPAHLGEMINVYSWVQSFRSIASLRRYAVTRGGELLMAAATEWVFVDFEAQRPKLIPREVSETFPLVPADDPALVELGIARPVRCRPSAGL